MWLDMRDRDHPPFWFTEPLGAGPIGEIILMRLGESANPLSLSYGGMGAPRAPLIQIGISRPGMQSNSSRYEKTLESIVCG